MVQHTASRITGRYSTVCGSCRDFVGKHVLLRKPDGPVYWFRCGCELSARLPLLVNHILLRHRHSWISLRLELPIDRVFVQQSFFFNKLTPKKHLRPASLSL